MVARILVNKQQCQIIDEYDIEFLRALDKELSFWVQGAERSAAYLGYVDSKGKLISWDGHKRLLSKTLKFSPGLLPRVKRFFEKHTREYQIENAFSPSDPAHPKDITQELIKQGKVPYYYQLDTVKKVKQYERGIIRIATGGGKTLVAALLAAELGKETVIYVIGKDLLYQLHALFTSLFKQKIGIIGDGKCEISDINIATVWTVGQALGCGTKDEEEDDEQVVPSEKNKDIRDMLGRSRLHIFDECHLAACDTIQEICKRINPENIYGMSASPWRDDGADLLIENYLGETIVDIPAKTLIAGGFLVPPMIRFLAVAPYPHKRKRYQTVYSQYIINNDQRNQMIAKGAKKLVEQGFQTLVLFHAISHGKILHDLISKEMPCEILSGKDNSKTREKVKKKLEAGKSSCVLASKIFDIGVDLPSLSGLIVAGGGKSSVRALQRIGRVIRKYPGKEKAAVLDFADQAPFLIEHSKARREIYSTEFNVEWPAEKNHR